VERWISKDSSGLVTPVHELVQKQWQALELAPESLIERLQQSAARHLGRSVELAIAEAVDPLIQQLNKSGESALPSIGVALTELTNLLGQPSESNVLNRPGIVDQALDVDAQLVVGEWQQKIGRFTLGLIDQPDFRIAGAEEACRRVVAIFEQILRHYEPLLNGLTERASKAYERLHAVIRGLQEAFKSGRRTSALITELGELIHGYPKWRYQTMVLRRVSFVLTSLRGYFSDQIRELNFSRLRLADLLSPFLAHAAAGRLDRHWHSRDIYPADCNTLEETLDRIFPPGGPAELADLERRVQASIQEQLGSLHEICTTQANVLKNVETIMLEQALVFAAQRMQRTGVMDVYLQSHSRPEEALLGMTSAFGQAMPAGEPPESGQEIALIAIPQGPENQLFKDMVSQALPEARQIESSCPEEITLYREWMLPRLDALRAAGESGAAAYRQMTASEHFPPHARRDIASWRPLHEP
jgi:hypothetical protein